MFSMLLIIETRKYRMIHSRNLLFLHVYIKKNRIQCRQAQTIANALWFSVKKFNRSSSSRPLYFVL